MADHNDQVEVTTNEARAGSTPRMTRYILAISLVLIIVIFAILLFARQ